MSKIRLAARSTDAARSGRDCCASVRRRGGRLDVLPLNGFRGRTRLRIVPDDGRADDGLSGLDGPARADPDGADEFGGGIDLGTEIAPDFVAGLAGAGDGGIGPLPELHQILDEIGDFARQSAFVDGAIGRAGGAIVAGNEATKPPPAADGIGGGLPQLGNLAVGRQRDAGQVGLRHRKSAGSGRSVRFRQARRARGSRDHENRAGGRTAPAA